MNNLSQVKCLDLLSNIEIRFRQNMSRHPNLLWETVIEKIQMHPNKIWSLYKMEETGGEPDVIGIDNDTKRIIFADCAQETPKGRRSICYDNEALEARKQHKPKDSALNMANEMGIDIMTEQQYFELQKLGEFDLKTSSWLKTPSDIREKGGAIFGDRRFGRVFIYHNGADSYYGVRGFRGILYV